MDKYVGPERRKYSRVNANFIVSYRIKKETADYDLTQSKNVSQGGMLLTTNKLFANGTLLELTIRFPFISERIKVVGAVMSCREVARNLIYETRINFLDLDQNFFQKIGEYIIKHPKKISEK